MGASKPDSSVIRNLTLTMPAALSTFMVSGEIISHDSNLGGEVSAAMVRLEAKISIENKNNFTVVFIC
jgi:hypothetical protein